MTALTFKQKADGRAFRAKWEALLDRMRECDREDGYPHATCPPYTVWFRHTCQDRGSQALFLHQSYAPSPDGLFVFTYRQGTCPRCSLHVRSTGFLARNAGFIPEKGAIVHAPYELRAVPQGQGGPAPAPRVG